MAALSSPTPASRGTILSNHGLFAVGISLAAVWIPWPWRWLWKGLCILILRRSPPCTPFHPHRFGQKPTTQTHRAVQTSWVVESSWEEGGDWFCIRLQPRPGTNPSLDSLSDTQNSHPLLPTLTWGSAFGNPCGTILWNSTPAIGPRWFELYSNTCTPVPGEAGSKRYCLWWWKPAHIPQVCWPKNAYVKCEIVTQWNCVQKWHESITSTCKRMGES